jgi:hypothetical protein
MLQAAHGPAVRTLTIGALLALIALPGMHVTGCGGAQRKPPEPRPSRRSDELAMRAPGTATATPGSAPLGSLQPVAVTDRPEPRVQPAARAANIEQPPIFIDNEQSPRPHPLHDGALVLPGGLIIHRVPRNVTARMVVEQGSGDPVLELVDPRGRRIALLKETPISHVAMPGGAPLLGATEPTHSEAKRERWATSPVPIVVDRFSSETHLYAIERRASGTDWIWSGLELSPRRADGSSAP